MFLSHPEFTGNLALSVKSLLPSCLSSGDNFCSQTLFLGVRLLWDSKLSSASHCHFQAISPPFLEAKEVPALLRFRLPDLKISSFFIAVPGDFCTLLPPALGIGPSISLYLHINSCHGDQQFQPSLWLIGYLMILWYYVGFPGGAGGKEPDCQCRRLRDSGSIPDSGRSPGGRQAWQPTPVFLPGESHG